MLDKENLKFVKNILSVTNKNVEVDKVDKIMRDRFAHKRSKTLNHIKSKLYNGVSTYEDRNRYMENKIE